MGRGGDAVTEHELSGGPAPPNLDEIRAVLARAGGGDRSALPRLRALLDETELWRQLGDLAAHAELTWIRHVSGTDLAMREMMARKVCALKAELGGPVTSALERLLIDRIAINWLMVSHADLEAAGTKDGDPRRADMVLKRQTQAMQRYATAIKALATIRRLLPTTTSTTGAGPAARPTEAGTQEDEVGPESRRPKPGTAEAATLTDDRDPAKGPHVALPKLDRDDRERDG
jgi:hypothetical protein